jgi:hypothetical protein
MKQLFSTSPGGAKLRISLHFRYWQFTFVSLFEGVV